MRAARAKYQEDGIRFAVEGAKKRGVKDPEPVIRTFIAKLEKWNGIVSRIGHDRERFAEALRTEIYQKVEW